MKNKLLFNFTKILFRKKSFRMAALAVLTLLSAQSSFAQVTYTWGGVTSTDFLTGLNWNAVPVFTDATNIYAISPSANNPILNTDGSITALSCNRITIPTTAALTTNIPVTCSGTIFMAGTSTLTTNADFTSTSTSTSFIDGTININSGIFTIKHYLGSSALTTVNIAAGGTLIGSGLSRIGANFSANNAVNVNGGTYSIPSGASLDLGTTSARKGFINLNSGLVQISGGLNISTTAGNGNIVVAGGSFEYNPANLNVNLGVINVTAGSFKLLNTTSTINATSASVGTATTGVINIAGGTLDTSGPLTIGHPTTTTALVTVNVNSGTMNVAGALNISAPTGVYTGLVNIDAGSIVLDGNQTAGIAALITASRIKTSGAALAAGKIISNTYNAGTNKTTVVAVAGTIWNGGISTWSNGAPTASLDAIIEGDYSTTTNGSFTANKLTVSSGALTINSGTSLTVQNEVNNNGSLVVENNANLIQVLGTTNTNIGNVVVNRNSNALSRLDYTLWSSPVSGQNLAAFSPLTSQSQSRFYAYDTANNQYSNAFDPTATSFVAGTGYLIRMPNTAVAFPATEIFAGQFTGVPNNGDVPVALSTAGNTYNLVGNPYPSTINLYTLQANNSTIIGNTFYMWRTTNATGTAYCTYVPTTTTTGTYVSNNKPQSPGSGTFVGDIQPGQGFFVTALTTGPLVFKNGQRVATATSFFRTKQVVADKVWLNATNATGDFSQMAVTYFDGATPGVDAFDGKYINDSPLALTSNINNDEYTIQGRPGFDASDVVPLNFKTAVAGDYTIAIDHSEGVFAAGQSVILADAATGTETDLTTSSYTFTAPTGTANSRFSLKYQKTLGTNKAIFSDNNVAVYRSKGTLYVNAGDTTIANIKVYDVQGKLVTELKNVKATSASIANLKATNQVLVVKITSQENTVVIKKVVN